jgi:hypothetical protein
MTNGIDQERFLRDVAYTHHYESRNRKVRKTYAMHPLRNKTGKGIGQFSIRKDSDTRGQEYVSDVELAELFAIDGFSELGINLRMLPVGPYDGGPPPGLQPSASDVVKGSAFASVIEKQHLEVMRRSLSNNLHSKLVGVGIGIPDRLLPRNTAETPSDDTQQTLVLLSPGLKQSPQPDADSELSGIGYESDPKIRRTIELYAVAKARAYYERRSYSVTERGKPFDLLCEKAGEIVHVEVKGSRYDLNEIIVTTNEVTDARDSSWRSDLFLVSKIVLAPDGMDGFTPSQGLCRLAQDWNPEDRHLTPMQYRCKTPPAADVE